jgi:site-specific recombinase XerD
MQTERLSHAESQVQTESNIELLFGEFLLSRKAANFTPQTIRHYDYTMGAFKGWLTSQGVSTIDQITGLVLRSYIRQRLDSGEKTHTTHCHYRALNCLFHWLEREEVIEKNPMNKVDPPKLPKELLPPLSLEEVSKIEKVLQGKTPLHIRNQSLFYLLLDTGLRVSECTNMKVGDVDLETGVWIVTGKGRKDRVVRIGTTGLKHLKRYLVIRNGKDGSPLWVGERGPMTVNGVMETIEKMGKKAEVHVSAHQLRRTFAVQCLRNGMDLIALRNLMGHESIVTTQRYLLLADTDMVEAHEKFSPLDKIKPEKPTLKAS